VDPGRRGERVVGPQAHTRVAGAGAGRERDCMLDGDRERTTRAVRRALGPPREDGAR